MQLRHYKKRIFSHVSSLSRKLDQGEKALSQTQKIGLLWDMYEMNGLNSYVHIISSKLLRSLEKKKKNLYWEELFKNKIKKILITTQPSNIITPVRVRHGDNDKHENSNWTNS